MKSTTSTPPAPRQVDRRAQAHAQPQEQAQAQAQAAGASPRIHELSLLTDQLEINARRQRALEAERLSVVAKIVAWSQSATDSSRRELDYRAARAEVASMLRVSEYRAEREMSLAYDLFEHYPRTATALAEAQLDLQHVRAVVEAGYLVGAGEDEETVARRANYEQAVLDVALQETPNRLQPVARRIAEHWATTSIDERHRFAARQRRVTVVPLEDGMADLIAHIPAVDAYAIKEHLTDLARAAERSEGRGAQGEVPGTDEAGVPGTGTGTGTALAPRSRDELRADALRDLLLGGSFDGAAVTSDRETTGARRSGSTDGSGTSGSRNASARRALIEVVIPVSAVMPGAGELSGAGVLPGMADSPDDPSASDRPGQPSPSEICELRGYGPIGTETARAVAASAVAWNRVFVDEDTGAVLAVDRYRPSEEMRRFLAARDGHCRFPGCRVPTQRCDIDHTHDAALGGPTATDNLAHLCRGHHTLKHHSEWRTRQDSGGVLTWTSPTGRSYTDRPREHLPEQQRRVRFTAN